MLITSLLLATALGSAPVSDEAQWLTRLQLPKLFTVSIEPQFTDDTLHIEYFELDFPKDSEEKVRDAKERHESGERSARLMHQAALGYLKLGDTDMGRRLMDACLQEYANEIEASPDDYELRLYCADAYRTTGKWTWKQEFFERMQEQYLAAAELRPGEGMPGVLCAKAQWMRWMQGKSKNEEQASWLAEGLERAREAVAAEPSLAGGAWWCFLIRAWQVQFADSNLAVEEWLAQYNEAIDQLVADCEEVEGAPRLQFAARFYAGALKLGQAKDVLNDSKELALSEAGTHVEGLLKYIDAFEGELDVTADAATLCWSYHCMVKDGTDYEDYLELMQTLGLETEDAYALACYMFQLRDLEEPAARFAQLLEENLATDRGRAGLIAYRYLTNDAKGALELVDAYDEVTPDTNIQRGVLLLHTGEREEALELLESLTTERAEDGYLLHALGVARALAGQLESAVETLEAAVRELKLNEDAQTTLDEVRELLENATTDDPLQLQR